MEGLWEITQNLSGSHQQVVPITVFVAVLCLCLVIGHMLEENRWVNESITALIIVIMILYFIPSSKFVLFRQFCVQYSAKINVSSRYYAVFVILSFTFLSVFSCLMNICMFSNKGCVTGTIILLISKGKSSHILIFDEELFFIYLLPPIIFNAGFQVKKKQFFHNFFTIMLFGVVGVFISSFIITAGSYFLFPKFNLVGLTPRDYLGIGTIFSSTDTVCTLQVLHQEETPLLYSLVFGEGVVNDATSVVLFNAIQKLDISRIDRWTPLQVLVDFLYLFSTSTALGVASGLLTAIVLKGLYFGRHSSIREISLMVLMAYLSYMLAELFGLSGILTVFFTGIFMSHYVWHNVTDSSRITTKHVFAMMSFIAEAFIFLYVGMDALDIQKWKMSKLSFWNSIGIYSTVMLLIMLGRAAFLFPLCALSNCLNRSPTRSSSLTPKHQVIIWWAGLMRGAVSIALAFKQFTQMGMTLDPIHATLVTTTIIIVLFSTIVFGFLTRPLVSYLAPHTNTVSRETSLNKEDITLPLLSTEESASSNLLRAKESLSMLIERPVYTIHSLWRRFDDSYMRPIFGGPRSSNHSAC